MGVLRRSVTCDRVREQVSLELDGELSELERRMLAAHTERCSACAGYAEAVTRFTVSIRESGLESPERPVVITRSGRAVPDRLHVNRLRVGVAAAIALAAFGLGTDIASRPSPSASLSLGTVSRFPTEAEVANELTLLQLARHGDSRNRSAVEI